MCEYQKYLEEKNMLGIKEFQTIVKGLRTVEAAWFQCKIHPPGSPEIIIIKSMLPELPKQRMMTVVIIFWFTFTIITIKGILQKLQRMMIIVIILRLPLRSTSSRPWPASLDVKINFFISLFFESSFHCLSWNWKWKNCCIITKL